METRITKKSRFQIVKLIRSALPLRLLLPSRRPMPSGVRMPLPRLQPT